MSFNARGPAVALVMVAACAGGELDRPSAPGEVAGTAGASGASGGSGSSGDAGAAGAGGAAGTGGGAVGTPNTQAIRRIFLGDTDPDGTVNKEAWRKVGVDVDGVTSTATSKGHCKPAGMGKSSDIQDDGDNGIDNSFGRNILPLIASLSMGDPASTALQKSINDGGSTLMLSLDNLPEGPTGAGVVTGSFFVGVGPKTEGAGGMGSGGKSIPVTDDDWAKGTYTWNLLDSVLASTTPPISKVVFNASTLKEQVWDAGAKADVLMLIPVKGVPVKLNIRHAAIRMTFSADHRTTTNGVLGGVLVTDEFVGDFQKVAPRLSTLLCNAALLGIISDQLRASSDLMKDGTQDGAKTCDGISIGVSFESASAKLGSVVSADPPPDKDPCTM